jgi:nucleotidyltransferase/DNA polymerase involved in DNA repair
VGADWYNARVIDGLKERRVGLCSVDAPRLEGLPPLSDLVTSDIAYVRFHGRNEATWWNDDAGSRYEYLYSKDELSAWVPRLEAMSTQAKKVRVYFNNHRRGDAPEDAAQKLRKDIREETGLSPSIALSTNKTVSKVATRVFCPAGFVALSSNEESSLIRMQPVGLLPGAGPVLLGRFGLLESDEIGDLADLSECEARAIGPRGPELVTRARGVDTSSVNPEPPDRRAVSGEVVFEPDPTDPEVLRLRLEGLVAELGFTLRKEGRGARRASIELASIAEGKEGPFALVLK